MLAFFLIYVVLGFGAFFFGMIEVIVNITECYEELNNKWSKKQCVLVCIVWGPIGWSVLMIWGILRGWIYIWNKLKDS